jgi:hypothetical protein
MTVSELILPYYENEFITKQLAKAIDNELEEIRNVVLKYYLAHIQTDFRKAYNNHEIQLYKPLITNFEKWFNIIFTNTKTPHDTLYAICLLYQASNIILSKSKLQEFIKNFENARGMKGSQWNIFDTELKNNNVFIRVTDRTPGYELEMINLKSFLELILPAHLNIEVSADLIHWEHIKDINAEWKTIKNEKLKWAFIKYTNQST